MLLETQGYEVSLFEDVSEALDAAVDDIPDLFLVGMTTKAKRAQKLCSTLKSNEKTSHIPILVSGEEEQLANLIESIDLGADDFFVKPLEPDELLAKIKSFVRFQSGQQELRESNRLLEKKEKELAERNEQLRHLYEISQKLAGCLELDHVIKVLFYKVHELLAADRCFLQLVSRSGQEITGLFKTHVDLGEIKHHAIPVSEEGALVKKVIEEKKPIVVKRAKAHPLVNKQFAYRNNLKTVLFVPLISTDRVVGILLICLDKQGGFTDGQIELAQIIAGDVAFSIERAKMYEKTKDIQSTLKAVVEWGDSEIIMVDKDRNVRAANRKFCKLMGVNQETVIGKDEKESVIKTAKSRFKAPDVFEARLDWLRNQSTDVVTDYIEIEKPVPRALERFSGPVYDSQGQFIGRVDVYHDVTMRKKSETRIRSLYRRERKIAQILQKNLLPKNTPEIPGFSIGTKYSAAVQGMVIGGDYFDFIYLSDNLLAFAIGDVCGKGISSAVQTYLVKYSLRAFAREDPDPSIVMSRLNWTFCQEAEEGAFVSLVFAVLDHQKDTLRYCVAGHPQPIVYQKQKKRCLYLKSNGGIVGVLPDSLYQSDIQKLETDDTMVFYTDGIIEARSGAEFFGEDKLKEVIMGNSDKDAQHLADVIFSTVSEFTSNQMNDDVAILVVKKTGWSPVNSPRYSSRV